jgi:glycosyltransferase involved in cell wall biosynthesis
MIEAPRRQWRCDILSADSGSGPGLAHPLSIIIPAYRSEGTIARCLDEFRAQGVPAEIIVIDSGPEGRSASIAASIPGITVITSEKRLLPHAARNVGVRLSQGELLLFTDPDIYPAPEAVAALLSAQEEHGGAVAAVLVSHGRSYLERALHLAKFDLWLPGGKPRLAEIAPTCGLLCTRAAWEAAGGFRDDLMLGDTLFSWTLKEQGTPIHIEPQAVFRHDHTGTWCGLLAERFARGRELGGLRRASARGWRERIWHVFVTLTLLRPARVTCRSVLNAWRAGLRRDAVATLPIVASGHLAWFAGELAGMLVSPVGVKR